MKIIKKASILLLLFEGISYVAATTLRKSSMYPGTIEEASGDAKGYDDFEDIENDYKLDKMADEGYVNEEEEETVSYFEHIDYEEEEEETVSYLEELEENGEDLEKEVQIIDERDDVNPVKNDMRRPTTHAINANDIKSSHSFRTMKMAKGMIPDNLKSKIGKPRATRDMQSRHVFGNDDRFIFQDTSFPFSTVGRVSTGCTGTMIGPHHVLTASHCLSSEPMTFTPSYFNGKAPFGTASVTNVIFWELVGQDSGLSNEEVAFDYAVLILDCEMGHNTGWMGVKVYSESWNNEPYWSNIGYPVSVTNNQRPVYTGSGAIWTTEDFMKNNLEGKLLGHFIDIEPGHSGGPLYATWNDGPYIIGVISSQSYQPSYTLHGDNQAGSGQAMFDLVVYALEIF